MYKKNEITLELVGNGKRKFQEIDIVSFVKKPIENFVFKKQVKDNRIPLTYFENKKLFSNKNIFINNRNTSFKENKLQTDSKEENFLIVNGPVLHSPFKDLYITNKTTLDINNKEVPLFYYDSVEGTNLDLKIETNIEDFEEKSYSIEGSTIFHNFENKFDEESGEFLLYYLEYLDDKNKPKRKILNSYRSVRQLTWEDVDFNTGKIKEGLTGYELQENIAEYSYYFNESDKYYYYPKQSNYIYMEKPKGREVEDSWHIEISNGEFKTIVDNTLYTYKVNEYSRQEFAPTIPFIYSVYFSLDWVSDKVLKSDTGSIERNLEKDLNIDIFVFDEDNNIIRCLTTNRIFSGKRFKDTDLFWETEVINSVDSENGFIDLNEKFSSRYYYKANFYYERKTFEYKEINLNPLLNKDVFDYFYVVYCIPNLYSYEKSIHYLKVDLDGRIAYCSQGDGLAMERANYPVLSLRDENKVLNKNTIVGKKYSEFLEKYSSLDLKNYVRNKYQYLVLGEMGFIENNDVKTCLSFDVSKKGDCFKKEKRKDVFRKNSKLLQSKYGYGEEGYKFTKDNSALIEVPLSLAEGYGGTLSQEEIIDVIENKTPACLKNVIHWVYPKSKVTITCEKEGEVTITFLEKINSDEKYVLYRKKNLNDKYDKIKELNANIQFYNDKDLESQKIYYYKLRIEKNGIIFPEVEEVEVFVK